MRAIELVHRVVVPTASPASIAFHEEGIWIADVDKRLIVLVDYRSGSRLRDLATIVRRPQTISWDGSYLWEYDEETSDLYKHGIITGTSYRFGRVEGVNTPYYGFTYHGRTLWLLSPDQPEFTVSNNQISVIDFPRNIQSETFDAPTYSCRGLSHDGSYLWTLDVEGREVFALDPSNGEVLTSYTLPECDSPSSLIVTEDRIWTLNLKTNELLTYMLHRDVQYSLSGGRRSEIDLMYTLRNSGPGKIRQIELYNSLPDNYINQRIIEKPQIEPAPDYSLESQWDEGVGQVVVHDIRDLGPAVDRQIKFSFTIDTMNLTYHLYPHKIGHLDSIPEHIRKKYLLKEMMNSPDEMVRDIVRKAQLLFQTGEREICDKVAQILHGETNLFWIARRLYNFVVDNIKYVLPYTSISSRKILSQGKGSCGNHATIFIAFCQVAGLPSRSIVGFSVWKDDSRLGYLDHEIPEVYFPNYGWVPIDTSRFMSLPIYGTHPLTKFRSFGSLNDRFFVNGFGRDLLSPFALKRHTEERLARVDEPCEPDLRFFMRWNSQPIETWRS
ncbi:transglutaminase domain-containing protein [bacterium]|nr:transglutaminase domain-containing protein [bacterium]